MAMTLSCSEFVPNSIIPSQYTCEGKNVSPPLYWTDAPKSTKSLVLIMDDPDAPNGVWDHWILFNIPVTNQKILEGNVPNGAVGGLNSWGKITYGGPCPPSGTHHYRFKLYAIDKILSLREGATKPELMDAIRHHILDESVLIGLYSK